MENTNQVNVTRKDYYLSILAGFLIGLLLMPIVKTANQNAYEILRIVIIPFFVFATPVGLKIAGLIARKISIVWQIAKFGLIGLLNTLVDIGVLAFLIVLSNSFFNTNPENVIFSLSILTITVYSIYKAISFIIANINSYYWNKYWTFDKGVTKNKAEFVQFFIVSLIGFTINVVVASYVFKSIGPLGGLNIGQWGLIGAAFGSIAGLTWNFVGYKFWVFKK